MARKQIKTVHLERCTHREAKQRLRLAYTYLIEEVESKQPQTDKKVKASHLQEVN